MRLATLRYYLSLGTNLHRRAHLTAAVRYLRAAFHEVELSPVYRSAAFGFDGPDFYNMVVSFDSAFTPPALKQWTRELELSFGRIAQQDRFSNRFLDIDMLLAGQHISGDKNLILPRPELMKRAYVLKPLVDLAPNLRHPEFQLSMQALWEKLPKKDKHSLSLVDSHAWFD